jgi:hypothetical protein
MSKLNNFYPYSFSLDYFEGNRGQFMDKLVQQIQQVDPAHVVILFAYEWQPLQQVLSSVDQITSACNHKIVWVFEKCFYYASEQTLIDTGIDVHLIEFDLLTMHFELNIYKSSTLSQCWNPDSNKFLFLTGKPNKTNRLRLLHKFYKQDLLDQCVWSLFMDNQLRQQCRALLPELLDQEYHEFIDTHISNPDKIDVLYGSGGSCHYDGYPFDKTLYEQTLFRVIAETQMFSHPIVSEKTWVTIANQQPFIMAGYQHNLVYLKELGYRTFENYLKINNYDSIDNTDIRLDAVVENVKDWLTTIGDNQTEIALDIKHNYQLLLFYMNKTVETFNSIYRKLGAVEFEPFRIISIAMQRSNWINFYYGIKSPSWPDCFSEKDFNSLPVEIQKECIDVYGYTPT